MKITRKSITASAQVAIPAPFDEYYTILPDSKYEELTGTPARPSPCEEANYPREIKHIYYLVARPEWREELDYRGIRDVELVRIGGNTISVCYTIGNHVFTVYDTMMPGPSTVDEVNDAFEDDPVAGIAAMFSISYEDAEVIFDWYDVEGSTADFDDVSEFLDYVNDDIWNMLDAADDQEFADKIRVALGEEPLYGSSDIESCDQVPVESATKTGLEYWYYSRHGMGPGTIPKGVQVLDWYEEGYKTWMLLDQVLHTDELNYYDLKEETPPAGSVTHNGTVIESCSQVTASEATKVAEDDNSIEYVVASDDDVNNEEEEENEWFVVDSRIPERTLKEEQKRWAQMELDDEADFYDREHHEGRYADIAGASDDAAIDRLRESEYLDPDAGVHVQTENSADLEAEEQVYDIAIDAIVDVDEDTSWKFEDRDLLDDYKDEAVDFDTIEEDFEYVIAWSIPADEGRYKVNATVRLVYTPDTDLYGDPHYMLDTKASSVTAIDIKPAGRKDFDEDITEVVNESTESEGEPVEASNEIEAAADPVMTEADLDDAILNGKPFDLASFKKYKMGEAEDGILRADEVQVGDIINITETAEEVNRGTRVKILSINDPGVDWADYTFHVELLDSPEFEGRDPYYHTSAEPGQEMDIHFLDDEYIGPRD